MYHFYAECLYSECNCAVGCGTTHIRDVSRKKAMNQIVTLAVFSTLLNVLCSFIAGLWQNVLEPILKRYLVANLPTYFCNLHLFWRTHMMLTVARVFSLQEELIIGSLNALWYHQMVPVQKI
jgi:hypothetical protein